MMRVQVLSNLFEIDFRRFFERFLLLVKNCRDNQICTGIWYVEFPYKQGLDNFGSPDRRDIRAKDIACQYCSARAAR